MTGAGNCFWSQATADQLALELDFRQTVDEPSRIKQMVFGHFSRCLYPLQKFDSDTERRFAEMLDAAYGGKRYSTTMQNLRTRIDHPDTTPSAQVLSQMREQGGFSNCALHLAQRHTAGLQAQAIDTATQAHFAASVKASWQKQQQLEAQEQGSFEDFVARYYA